MSDPTPRPVKLQSTAMRDGLNWFLQAIRTFSKQPLALGSLFILTLLVFQLIVLVPLLGLLAWVVVSPAVSVGLMSAMAQADAGQTPKPPVLWAPFRTSPAQTKALIRLGASYLVGVLLISVMTWLIFGAEMSQFAKASKDTASISMDFSRLSMGFAVYLGIVAAALMAFTWHAPALVFWYQTPPLKALVFSAMTCIHNFGAMLAYFAAWAVIFVPLAIIEQWLVSDSNTVVAILFFTLQLMVGAAFVLSSFFTFKGSVVQTVQIP